MAQEKKNATSLKFPVFCIVYSQPTKAINHRVLMSFHQPLPFCHSKRIPTGYNIFHQYIVCNFFSILPNTVQRGFDSF
jgi:hypothetical protein